MKILNKIVVYLTALVLVSLASLVHANDSCEAYFTRSVQSHSNGSIAFLLNAQTLNNPDKYLPTTSLHTRWFSWEKSCGAQNCVKTGSNAQTLDLPAFPENTSNATLYIPVGQEQQINGNHKDVQLAFGATLRFSENQNNYHIKNLSLEWGSTVYFSPGNYWIENFNILGVSQIKVEGDGQVNIFIKNDFKALGANAFNVEGNPEQLALVGYKDINLGVLSETHAVIYAKEVARLGALSRFEGSINAKTVLLGSFSQSVFINDSASELLLGNICGGAEIPDQDGDGIPDDEDDDIDGDGFSNDDEIDAGTDPYDPDDFPDVIAPEVFLNHSDPEIIENELIVLQGTITDVGDTNLSLQVTSDRLTEIYNAQINNNDFSVELPLLFGENLVTFLASDSSGNTSELTTLVVRVDDTEPELLITSPIEQSIEAPTAVIEGSAFDVNFGKGLDRVEITNDQFPGNVIVASLTDSNFSEQVNLAFGLNTIQVKAIDLQGLQSSQILEITRVDQTPPSIVIVQPVTGAELESSSVLVSGIASDGEHGSGLSQISISNSQFPQQNYPVTVSDDQFSAQIPLAFGSATIVVSVLDFSGNIGQKNVTLSRVDNTAPTITLDSIANETESTAITLSGSVADNANGQGIDRVELTDSNGTQVLTLTNNEFSVTVPLTFGSNSFDFVVYDLAGNSANASQSINRVDTTAPTITLDSIASDTEATEITLSGSVADNTNGQGIDRVELTDSSGTQVLTLTNNEFSVTVPLVFGSNSFDFEVYDLAGNSANASQSINRVDNTPPTISLDAYSSELEALSVLLSGSAQDNANGQGLQSVLIRDQQGQETQAALNEGAFNESINLYFDENQITLIATDIAGNQTEENISITRVDNTAPDLQIDNPATQILRAAEVTVSGSASDNAIGKGLDRVEINANGNVQLANLSSGSFSEVVALQVGLNQISVTAIDLAGNQTPQQIEVTRPDLDGDGIADDVDPDIDNDNFDNETEIAAGTDPYNPNDYPDTVAPVVSIATAPQSIEATEISIVGTASDAGGPRAGIAQMSATNSSYPGVAFAVGLQAENFSSLIPLELGENLITISASDAFGNSHSQSVSIQRVSPPRFEQVTPEDGSVVQTPTITLEGFVTTDQPLSTVSFYINEWQVTPSGNGGAGRYPFKIENIPMEIGVNTFALRTVSTDGTDTQTLNITYQPEDADQIAAPALSLLAPNTGAYISDPSFKIVGQAESFAGKLSVSVNNETVALANNFQTYFEHLVSFPEGEDELTVTITASDQLGKSSQVEAHYYRDDAAPVILLPGLSESPVLNSVMLSPYIVSGVVNDMQLANVSVNGQPLTLQPGNTSGEYLFDLSVSLSAGEEKELVFKARDLSGNQSTKSYILQSLATAEVALLQPTTGQQFNSGAENLLIDIVAKAQGLTESDSVQIYVQGDTPSTLSVENTNAGLVIGQLEIPQASGTYPLVVEVLNSSNQVIAQSESSISVLNADDIPVELLSHQPENMAELQEVTETVELYFNKAIDPNLLKVSLHENFQGYTYINKGKLGEEPMFTEGYQLEQVNRIQEPIEGGLSVLPGSKQFTYEAKRSFAYNADVYVEVAYDGETLTRFSFKTRPLPTFVNGVVQDAFGAPVKDVEVALPALNRTTSTNKDGQFAFGYREFASQVIPSGRYRIEVNAAHKNPEYGNYYEQITLTEGRRNKISSITLQGIKKTLPYNYVASGQHPSLLANGDLVLDLSDAKLVFPDNDTSGAVHTQVLMVDQIPVRAESVFKPTWIFANQPRGIQVNGAVGIDMAIPRFKGSYNYIPENMERVVLVAFDAERYALNAVGVGKVENQRVVSEGKVAINSFDYFGYMLLPSDMQTLLKDVGEGHAPLLEIQRQLDALIAGASTLN